MTNDNIIQIFQEEARDLLDKIQYSFNIWKISQTDSELLTEILRNLHTLKGSSRMVGLVDFTESVQTLENTIRNIYENKKTLSNHLINDLQSALDYLRVYVDEKILGPSLKADDHGFVEYIRIEPEKLEKFSLLTAEINVSHQKFEHGIKNIIDYMGETIRQISFLRDQTKQLMLKADTGIHFQHQGEIKKYNEFDPLEMDVYSTIHHVTRGLAERANKVESLILESINSLREIDGKAIEQKRTVKLLEESIMDSRLIPVRQIVPRLERLTRQVAKELSKKVELHLDRIEGVLDRKILEELLPSFEHIIRNAIDHGIDEKGTLTLSIYRQGNYLIAEIADDGRGINIEKVRQQAVEKKLWPDEKEMSLGEAIKIILRPGFSTKGSVTLISGQGVGLDVVNAVVNRLGGNLTIKSKLNLGTKITLQVPITLSSNQALIFVLKDTFYAIPILSLTAVQEYKTSDLQTLFKQNHRIKYNYDEYHLLYLRSALGYVDNQIDENENQSVIFLRYKAARTAVIVDRLIGSWEVVVKPLPIQLQEIKEFSGVTFLSDERPVLMLDPYTLTHKTYYLQNGVNQDPLTQLKPAIILIVDDSVTVRRITSGVLRRHHYDPRQARNGEEALQYMEAHRPDVVLLDLEMPGMDGFEVLEKMRLDPRLNNIPVIIITSRVGEKHQLQAQKFGISGYLSKPYLEDDLLNLLSDIVNA